MTKLRTLEELESVLSADLRKRKQELTHVRGTIVRNQNVAQRSLIRAGVMLLYSHWEGYVKLSARAYINFVSHQSVPPGRLKSNFLAIAVRQHLRDCGVVRPSKHNAVVELLRAPPDQVTQMPEDSVDTKDNLRGDAFREIMALLGIEFAKYAAKENFISYTLCDQRNEIAHGSHRAVAAADYDEMHNDVLWLIDSFRDDIMNAAATLAYKR
jgi:MAE_28990/MAE_18760-like HEPN